MKQKVLVCGGRNYADRKRMNEVLTLAHGPEGHIGLIIVGGARGADKLAEEWARRVGVDYRVFPADWINWGNSAGPIRNQQMLDEGKPNLVIAFPGGRGTADMINRAARARVVIVNVR